MHNDRSLRANARILGWPLLLFIYPLALISLKENNMPRPDDWGHEPQLTDSWLRTQWCAFCQTDTDQEYKEWHPDSVVERECLSCGSISEYVDRV